MMTRNAYQMRSEPNVLCDGLHIALSREEIEALAFLRPISPEYPDIEKWFINKVAPGLRSGTRHMIRIERQGRLVALGVGKMELGENKICTVRVAPDYMGRGLGVRIFDSLMEWMGTDRPHATVSEDRLPEFQRIFDHYGFRLTSVCTGRYCQGKAEYLFNEPGNPWL